MKFFSLIWLGLGLAGAGGLAAFMWLARERPEAKSSAPADPPAPR